MSSDTLPISPARFAAALKDLSLSSLHLKVLELRNSIAHLDYSNEQLRPFAEGAATAAAADSSSGAGSGAAAAGQPDPDCVDAIRENEEVIARMQARIALVRTEVEDRGVGWTEFQSKEEAEADAAAARTATATTNGAANGETQGGNPWADGTFQTGVIRNGEVHMDGAGAGARAGGGGSLTDEELRRRMEEQLRTLGSEEEDDDDAEGGMHL